jgi:hypothetical protein
LRALLALKLDGCALRWIAVPYGGGATPCGGRAVPCGGRVSPFPGTAPSPIALDNVQSTAARNCVVLTTPYRRLYG